MPICILTITYFYTNIAKSLIRTYRGAHLYEQEMARQHLSRQRELARERELVFLMGDFMSEWATKVPHLRGPGGGLSKEDAGLAMGLRLYAVEVIYGDIEGFLCYLVPGRLPGGNTTLSPVYLMTAILCNIIFIG